MESKFSDILLCFPGAEKNATFSQCFLAKDKTRSSVRECPLEHTATSPTCHGVHESTQRKLHIFLQDEDFILVHRPEFGHATL